MNPESEPVGPVTAGTVDLFPRFREPMPKFGNRGELATDHNCELVACLGCSHTYGLTSARFAWPAQLQRLLGNERFQVLNFGRRNFGLKLVIDWYERYAATVCPQRCVIQIPLYCRQPHPTQPETPQAYTAREGLYGQVRRGSVSVEEFVKVSPTLIANDTDRLEQFLDRLMHRDVVPTVVLYKSCKSLVPQLRSLMLQHHENVHEICRRLEVTCCNNEVLSNLEFGKSGMLIDQTHPNEIGNARIAREVLKCAFDETEYKQTWGTGRLQAMENRLALSKRSLKSLATRLRTWLSSPDSKTEDSSDIYPLW